MSLCSLELCGEFSGRNPMKIDFDSPYSNPLERDKFCLGVSQKILLIFFSWYVVGAVLHQCEA